MNGGRQAGAGANYLTTQGGTIALLRHRPCDHDYRGGRASASRCRLGRLASTAAVLLAAVLLGAPAYPQRASADDIGDVIRKVEQHAAQLHSACGHLVITREQSAGFLRALRTPPDAQLERRVEGAWAFKDGKRLFQGKRWVGDYVGDLTFVYDGERSFHTQNLGGSRVHSAIFAGQAPGEPCPLDYGWFIQGRPIATIIRNGTFSIAGRRADPYHGRLIRLEGREWPQNAARTVIWIAEERGFMPVRVERFLPNARAPLTVYETTRTHRIDGVWVPIQVREETRYEGTETIQLAVTEVQVNAVPDSVFNVAWVKQGYVWDNASKTMLQIQPSGQLGLGDWMASPVTPAVLTRMAVACLIFVALWLLVIGIQRSLRRMANRDGS